MIDHFHYTECGLDYVYLVNGYEVHDTPYGRAVSIDDADGLHRAIAEYIVTSPHGMRGQELRFLRSMLDVSQAALGEIVGVSRATIARWEGAPDAPISGSADRALRLAYALQLENRRDLALQVARLLREIDDLEPQGALFEDREGAWLPPAAICSAAMAQHC